MRKVLSTFGLLCSLLVMVGPQAFAQSKVPSFSFTGTLSGDQLVPPAESDASGTVIAVLLGNQLVVTGSYQDLSSPVNTAIAGGANIRMASPGEDGQGVRLEAEQPVLGSGRSMGLTTDGGTSGTFTGVFALSDEQIEALGAGLFYVQVYTLVNAAGELRGQIGANETFTVYRDAYRAYLAALEEPGVVVDATAEDLVGIWQDANIEDDRWQIYEDSVWDYLSSLTEVDAHTVGVPSSWMWEKSGPIATFVMDGQCAGRYSRFDVLYEDGRNRNINFEAGPCDAVGVWRELIKIDAEGNRVSLRE